VKIGWVESMVKFKEVVRVEEELRIALLHVSEELSKSTFEVLSNRLGHV
jgi:hypothetical protein